MDSGRRAHTSECPRDILSNKFEEPPDPLQEFEVEYAETTPRGHPLKRSGSGSPNCWRLLARSGDADY